MFETESKCLYFQTQHMSKLGHVQSRFVVTSQLLRCLLVRLEHRQLRVFRCLNCTYVFITLINYALRFICGIVCHCCTTIQEK